MSNLQVFEFKGSPITFQIGESTMVNATEMAKPFGKRPIDWLKYQQSQDYLDALAKVRNITLADLVKVIKGGSNPGTWMHEDVALEFARWLSPLFAIWCNDRIKEILTGRYANRSMSDSDLFLSICDRVLQQDKKIKRMEKLVKRLSESYMTEPIFEDCDVIPYSMDKHVLDFLENCRYRGKDFVSLAELYADYVEFCKASKDIRFPLKYRKFSSILRSLGLPWERRRRGIYFCVWLHDSLEDGVVPWEA